MKRSYNYTGRRKLDSSAFDIRLYDRTDAPFEVEIALHRSNMPEFPLTVIPWLEAYRGPRMMRYRLGIRAFAESSRRFPLTDFEPDEPVLFRIKLVDESKPTRPIFAWRDRIRPVAYTSNGQRKKSILPVYPCDLGHIAWRIDWTDAMRPVLKVNSRLNQARSVASIVKMDPDFAALVFPEVIRTVMARLLLQEADCEEDANENEWLVFSRNLVGEECVRYEDDLDCDKKSVEAYIERVVQSFGREADLVQRYIGFKTRSLQHENPLDGRTA